MHIDKILKILIPIIILATFVYFGYPIIKNRYFNNEETTIKIKPLMDSNQQISDIPDLMMNQNKDASESLDLGESLSGEKSTEDTRPPIDINERKVPEGETKANITTQHCDSGCAAFSMDLNLLEYCQQTCGLAPVKVVSDCDDKKDLEKDYCLKDLAIAKKDSSLCEKIQDANIKLTCQNRITQDIIEGQQL